MNGSFTSGTLRLARYMARPAGRTGACPGVILLHGFPIGPLDARQSAGTFPELIDRMAAELGWVAMTFNFRGCGESEGDFSLQGWIDDLRAAIDHLIDETSPTGIWLVGTNTGGSIATCVAANDPRVHGAALLSPRADFDDWAAQPRRFLEHAREIGAIRTPGFPKNFDEWSREFRRFRPVEFRLQVQLRHELFRVDLFRKVVNEVQHFFFVHAESPWLKYTATTILCQAALGSTPMPIN